MEEKINLILAYTLLAAKTVLTIDDAALFTGLAKSYIYKLTSSKNIPYYKQAKLIYFDKVELEHWMKMHKQQTTMEVEQQAVNYCLTKERKGGTR